MLSLRPTYSTIRLHDVWYAPELACRLIATSVLTNKDISALLENSKLKAYDSQRVLFVGTAKEGLYCVDQPEHRALTTNSNTTAIGPLAIDTDSRTSDTYGPAM